MAACPAVLQLCQVTSSVFIANARSACSEPLLRQHAVTLCVNVTKQQPFPPAAAGVAALRVPVYDRPDQDLYSHFDACADAIQAEAQRGGRCVIYCKNGRSRSAAVCAAYLMKYRELPLSRALQKVKTARHEIDPNAGFREQLERYELELDRRRGRTP